MIPWNDGTINFSVEENADQDVYTIRFNFERKSVERNHHLAWLRVPIGDAKKQVQKILTKALKIAAEEINDIRSDGNNGGG